MKTFSKSFKKNEKGQVLIIVALTFIALVAIVGLAIDMGYMYVSYARLHRAVDAAALAASGEFKRNYTAAALQGASDQLLYLNLNGENTTDSTIFPLRETETCDTYAAKNGLLPVKANLTQLIEHEKNAGYQAGSRVCTDPLRKIVRVRVRQIIPTFFLAVIGWHTYPIEAMSISEAATVDVMLAIDTSDSMTYGWTGAGKSGEDANPNWCNADDPTGGADGIPGSCFPFQDVKKAAYQFLDHLYFPYDRVGVVTFDKDAIMRLPLSDDEALIESTVLNLKVYEGNGKCQYYLSDIDAIDPKTQYPPNVGAVASPCRLHDNPTDNVYQYLDCPAFYGPAPNAKDCSTTNIGDGVALSGAILTGSYTGVSSYYPMPAGGWPLVREEALWVLLLLTDGAANSGFDSINSRLCPATTTTWGWFDGGWPTCRDNNVKARHCWSIADTNCINAADTTNSVDQANYDPDDRARDMFDVVASNGTLIFTIGMGKDPSIQKLDDINVPPLPPGEKLLQYGAFGTIPHKNNVAPKGLYYFGDNQNALTRIFLAIANNLATRINQ